MRVLCRVIFVYVILTRCVIISLFFFRQISLLFYWICLLLGNKFHCLLASCFFLVVVSIERSLWNKEKSKKQQEVESLWSPIFLLINRARQLAKLVLCLLSTVRSLLHHSLYLFPFIFLFPLLHPSLFLFPSHPPSSPSVLLKVIDPLIQHILTLEISLLNLFTSSCSIAKQR